MSKPEMTSRSARRHGVKARRRRMFLIGTAVVAVVAIALAAVLVFGGSDDSGDTASRSSDTTATTASGTQDTGAQDTSTPTTTANDAKPLASGVCSADQISGAPQSSGVRGNRQVVVLAFTNTSQRACTVNGVVAIDLVTDGGTQAAAVTTGGEAINAELVAQEIELAPGSQASMVMSFAPIAGPGDPGCVRASAMQVTLPASRGKVDVEGRVTVCGGGAIAVSPLQPGVVTP